MPKLAWLLTLVSSLAAAQPQGIGPMQFGARCDGASDDTAALAAAIDAAKSKGVPVLLPAAACAYADVLKLDGVKLIGRGDASTLWALDPLRAAIYMSGSGAEVRSLRLSGVPPTRRASPWPGVRILALGARDFVIDNVTIDTSTATGIQTARAATRGLISNNRIRNTRADAIHITGEASYIEITGNHVQDSGDDGIAVVSYQKDTGLSHHITARGNTVSDNRGGRSMSVVGGSDVIYENNVLSNSGRYACLYLAQEDSWKTLPIRNVIVRNNTLSNCGSGLTGHAAVMLFGTSQANAGVQIVGNDIRQSGQVGIRMFGLNSDVTIDGNKVSGAREALRLPPEVKATPYVAGKVGAQ